MTRAKLAGTLLAAALGGGELAAQTMEASSAVFIESYRFKRGLVLDRVTEVTVPVGVSVGLGRRASFALAGGYVWVDLRSADPQLLPHQRIAGALDTEARLSLDAVPGRLIVFATGVIPSGVETVEREELSILGAISSDLIGFATSSVGNGGNVGAGFAAAFPIGEWALGVGGTVRQPLGYRPVVEEPGELRPGADTRVRVGAEGPLARRTYVRAAGMFAHRAKAEVAGTTQNGVGNRFVGYLSVDQGIGSARLVAYAFDALRTDPQVEPTTLGAAVLPRGNLAGAGLRVAFPAGSRVSLAPLAEFRSSWVEDAGDLVLAGRSLRFGTDVRAEVGPQAAVVVQGSGVSGFVVQAGSRVGFRGFRAAVHLEVRR